MEIVALAFLLIAMSRGGTVPAHDVPPEGDHSSGAAPPSGDGATSTGEVVATVITGVVGLVGALTSGGTAAVAGGTAAAAAGGTAAVTGGTGGTGTVASTAGAAGVAAGAGGAGAGSAIEAAAVAAATSAALGVGIIVGVIMAFIIARRVVDSQEIDKDWQGHLLHLNANADSLHELEAQCVEAYLQNAGRTFTIDSVRDFRLDRYLMGQKLTFRGMRSIYRYIPPPVQAKTVDDLAALRRIRAFCFEVLRLRSGHGYRMIKNWNILTPPADWGMSVNTLHRLYESVLPGAGGLIHLPHAARGQTLMPRTCADSEDPQDPLQVRSREVETDASGVTLTTEELQNARVVAIMDAMRALRWDPRPAIEADRTFYAGEVLRALSWQGTPPEGITQVGERLRLDPAWFGMERHIHPAKIKLGESGWMV